MGYLGSWKFGVENQSLKLLVVTGSEPARGNPPNIGVEPIHGIKPYYPVATPPIT